VLLFDVGEFPAVGEDLTLTRTGIEISSRFPVVVHTDSELFLARANSFFDIVDNLDVVALVDLVVGILVDLQRQETEVEEIRLVDAGETLCEDTFDTEIHRAECGMFTRGTLTVVLAGDEETAVAVECALGECIVNP